MPTYSFSLSSIILFTHLLSLSLSSASSTTSLRLTGPCVLSTPLSRSRCLTSLTIGTSSTMRRTSSSMWMCSAAPSRRCSTGSWWKWSLSLSYSKLYSQSYKCGRGWRRHDQDCQLRLISISEIFLPSPPPSQL